MLYKVEVEREKIFTLTSFYVNIVYRISLCLTRI